MKGVCLWFSLGLAFSMHAHSAPLAREAQAQIVGRALSGPMMHRGIRSELLDGRYLRLSRKEVLDRLASLDRLLVQSEQDLKHALEHHMEVSDGIERNIQSLRQSISELKARHQELSRSVFVRAWLKLTRAVRRFLNRAHYQSGVIAENNPRILELLKKVYPSSEGDGINWNAAQRSEANIDSDAVDSPNWETIDSTPFGLVFPYPSQQVRVVRVAYSETDKRSVVLIDDIFGARRFAAPSGSPDGKFKWIDASEVGTVILHDGRTYAPK